MDWDSLQVAIVLALVVVVFFGFVRERLPPEITALGAVGVLLVSGIIGTDDVLGVFSNSAPITIAAMFVLSAALERTGVIDGMGRLLSKAAGRSPTVALGLLVVSVMVLSGFVNNTPVVVILTPVVITLAQALAVAPSQLLIPLSFASIFGGTTTLIGTSTNLLVDGVAQRAGLEPFGMFEMTAAGAIMGVVGVAYLVLFGPLLLPRRESLVGALSRASDRHFFAEVLVPLDSPLVGRSLKDAGFTEGKGLEVVDVIRDNTSHRYELDRVTLAAGDRIVVRSLVGDMLGLREAGDVAFGGRAAHVIEPITTQETVILEGVVGPRSRCAGKRVTDLNLRRLYGAYILGLHRQGGSVEGNFDQIRLRLGDTLLLEGPPESVRELFDAQELVNLTQPSERPLRRGKAPIAVGAVLAVMALAALEVLPIAALALIGATLVVGLRCVEPDEAYGAIRWNILMLIFAMLALSRAAEETGALALIVEGFAALIGGLGPVVMLSMVYLFTSVLTEIMSNNAVAILLTPIAVGLAGQLGVDPRPFAVAVMFAASASFATPIGYQTNTFVYRAGGYRFTDFLRIGVPLNLLYWAAATFLIPMFWPLDGS